MTDYFAISILMLSYSCNPVNKNRRLSFLFQWMSSEMKNLPLDSKESDKTRCSFLNSGNGKTLKVGGYCLFLMSVDWERLWITQTATEDETICDCSHSDAVFALFSLDFLPIISTAISIIHNGWLEIFMFIFFSHICSGSSFRFS